jgi:riboflavin kinase / FMN adenylyltransferase
MQNKELALEANPAPPQKIRVIRPRTSLSGLNLKPGLLKLPVIVGLGKFDGVHKGHQAIIARMKELRSENEGTVALVVLWPHPATVLHAKKIVRIQTFKQQVKTLNSYGVNILYQIRFTRKLAEMDPAVFLKTYIIDALQASYLVVGSDAAVGKNRSGDVPFMQSYLPQFGCQVDVAPFYKTKDDKKVGSRILQELLEIGDCEKVTKILGRYFSIEGVVVHGAKRGREIGFPTANISTKNAIIPHRGVYATFLRIGNKTFLSVTNIGLRPTFNDKDSASATIETHILSYEGSEVYDQRVELFFVKKLRPEKKFDHVAELIVQISNDAKSALQELERNCSVVFPISSSSG